MTYLSVGYLILSSHFMILHNLKKKIDWFFFVENISSMEKFVSLKRNHYVVFLLTKIFLVSGIGFGLIYLPAIVSVTCYFDKYRSIATGIGVCGSGFGTIVFAPLVSVCIEHFKLGGTLFVISFMVLTCIFYGLLLRPVPTIQEEETPNNNQTLYSPENVPLTTVTLVDDGKLSLSSRRR